MDFWAKAVLFVLSISMSSTAVQTTLRLDPDYFNPPFFQKGWPDWKRHVSPPEHHRKNDDNHDDIHAVVFAAIRGAMNSPPEQGDIIVFDQVQLNREGGYDPDTGIFTCPEDGIYFFAFSFLPGKDEAETTVALVKNNTIHALLYSSLPLGATQLSERSCLLRLKKGDGVWVTLEQGSVLMHQASLSFQGYRISS